MNFRGCFEFCWHGFVIVILVSAYLYQQAYPATRVVSFEGMLVSQRRDGLTVFLQLSRATHMMRGQRQRTGQKKPWKILRLELDNDGHQQRSHSIDNRGLRRNFDPRLETVAFLSGDYYFVPRANEVFWKWQGDRLRRLNDGELKELMKNCGVRTARQDLSDQSFLQRLSRSEGELKAHFMGPQRPRAEIFEIEDKKCEISWSQTRRTLQLRFEKEGAVTKWIYQEERTEKLPEPGLSESFAVRLRLFALALLVVELAFVVTILRRRRWLTSTTVDE